MSPPFFFLCLVSTITTTTTTAFSSLTLPTFTKRTTPLYMFTGIVEEMGQVVSLEERDDIDLWDGTKGKGTQLTVKANVVLEGAYLGCSICVSGVCLTATKLANDCFVVGLAPETLRKSNLGTLQPHDQVNLERASQVGGRNSGHFVQGHMSMIQVPLSTSGLMEIPYFSKYKLHHNSFGILYQRALLLLMVHH